MHISYNELLDFASKEHFAVPAFNYSDLWDLYAIVEAAQEERSPVILGTIPAMDRLLPLDCCFKAARLFAERAQVPVFCHLDHAKEVTLCQEAVDLGYDSVMIDASLEPFSENVARTKAVVAYAHAKGVSVEAEIGHIRGKNLETAYEGEDYLTAVEDAVRFVSETSPDALAIGIGTAHGYYTRKPEINIPRLDEIRHAVSTPLVLHGGTGLPDETVELLVQHGIQKINIGTDILMTLSGAIYEELKQKDGHASMLTLPAKGMDAVREKARHWIRVCGSGGHA